MPARRRAKLRAKLRAKTKRISIKRKSDMAATPLPRSLAANAGSADVLVGNWKRDWSDRHDRHDRHDRRDWSDWNRLARLCLRGRVSTAPQLWEREASASRYDGGASIARMLQASQKIRAFFAQCATRGGSLALPERMAQCVWIFGAAALRNAAALRSSAARRWGRHSCLPVIWQFSGGASNATGILGALGALGVLGVLGLAGNAVSAVICWEHWERLMRCPENKLAYLHVKVLAADSREAQVGRARRARPTSSFALHNCDKIKTIAICKSIYGAPR